MNISNLKPAFEQIAAETLQMADSAALSVERFVQSIQMPPKARLHVLEELQSEIKEGHQRALRLTQLLPSPNSVAPALAPSVAVIGKALFNFVHLCEIRQRILSAIRQDLCVQAADIL